MELPLMDYTGLITRFKQPGLIAIGFAAFFAFISLARRTVLLIFHRTRAISVSAPTIFSDDWSDSGPESESDSEASSSYSSEEGEENEMETSDNKCFGDVFRDFQEQNGNLDTWLSGAVVKTWEGLNLFGSSSDQSDITDDENEINYSDRNEIPVVQYWDDGPASVRPRFRRRRSFVMMDLCFNKLVTRRSCLRFV